MEYISAEEFLKQPIEVQKVFNDWWEPQKSDLVVERRGVNRTPPYLVWKCEKEGEETFIYGINSRFTCYEKESLVLLLTEGKLRQFIEEKTDSHVDIAYYAYKDNGYRGYTIELWKYSPYECIKQFKDLEGDLFQAYWKVALEIAKGEVEYGKH